MAETENPLEKYDVELIFIPKIGEMFASQEIMEMLEIHFIPRDEAIEKKRINEILTEEELNCIDAALGYFSCTDDYTSKKHREIINKLRYDPKAICEDCGGVAVEDYRESIEGDRNVYIRCISCEKKLRDK